MKMLDNINLTVRDDLRQSMHKGSKLSIAAACFSIYAYQELKKQLEAVDEVRFIFTSPTFIQEKTPKEKREFYIPRLNRERSLYGTEFEVKLRNELTQKAIAKECADWIRRKAQFRSNISSQQMWGFLNVDESTYAPINGFTTVDLGCERGNNAYYPVQRMESSENGRYYLRLFEEIWSIWTAPVLMVFWRSTRPVYFSLESNLSIASRFHLGLPVGERMPCCSKPAAILPRLFPTLYCSKIHTTTLASSELITSAPSEATSYP